MDVAAISMVLSQGQVQSQVGVAMLDKAMETNEELGGELVRMIDSAAMELSVNPHIGANLDIRI